MPPFFLQEDQMVTHFLSESGQAACGRGDSNVNGSSDVGQVSCKTCRRTNAFAQAQENAAPASAPVTPHRRCASDRQGRAAAESRGQARRRAAPGPRCRPQGLAGASQRIVREEPHAALAAPRASLSLSGSGTSRRMSARGHIRPAQHDRASPHQARPCASARARPSRAPASMSGRWRGSSASSASSDSRCAAVSKAIRRRSRRRPLKRS